MLARFFFLATLFAASALGAAVPTPTDSGLTPANMTTIGDPIVACKENNIDIHGPIPDDAVKQPDGSYHFTEGSNAYHWVRAQAALAESTDYKKREFANIGIGMFAKDWCGGNGAWFDDVSYGVQSYNTLDYFSVGISYRGLRNNEHLDFSKLKGNDWCGTYVYSAGFETPIGCFNSQAINCFRLWV